MKLEGLEQRILAIYDDDNSLSQGDICDRLHRRDDCTGTPCESCPLSMGYLAALMRKGRV